MARPIVGLILRRLGLGRLEAPERRAALMFTSTALQAGKAERFIRTRLREWAYARL